MKKKVLITSFDLEIGGVERSLINMLNSFDYKNYDVDLMLYSHTGDFMNLVPKEANLLEECSDYKTLRMSIKSIFDNHKYKLGIDRLLARLKAKGNGIAQMQYIWKYCLPHLPKMNKKYDVAISFLWPHYFVNEKVDADIKIGWIHTDYTKIDTDVDMDIAMWQKLDYIVAVSEECKSAFLTKYPNINKDILVIENITSPKLIQQMSCEKIDDFNDYEDTFKVLSVGRYSDAKGFDNAIKALRILHDREYKNIKWYIVGYGGDEALYRNIIKENNLEEDFILLGKRTNPYPYMKKCDLYAQPSRYEGKAVTVGEAQILGKAVMITNYKTAKSQLKDGVDGYIAELSVEGIADGVEKLYNDVELRKKFEGNCRNSNYSNEMELQKLYELF
ncbi:glycosyltransferase [Intestinibacter sp.]